MITDLQQVEREFETWPPVLIIATLHRSLLLTNKGFCMLQCHFPPIYGSSFNLIFCFLFYNELFNFLSLRNQISKTKPYYTMQQLLFNWCLRIVNFTHFSIFSVFLFYMYTQDNIGVCAFLVQIPQWTNCLINFISIIQLINSNKTFVICVFDSATGSEPICLGYKSICRI